jgi:hypothetical protein
MLCGVVPNVRKFLWEDFLAPETLESLLLLLFYKFSK